MSILICNNASRNCVACLVLLKIKQRPTTVDHTLSDKSYLVSSLKEREFSHKTLKKQRKFNDATLLY